MHDKIQLHINNTITADGYIYTDTYSGWLNEYNAIIKKYNDLTGSGLSLKSVQNYELSSSRKTVRTDTARAFAQSVKNLVERVNSEIQAEQNKNTPIPAHQMKICFKTGAKGCPLNPIEKKNKFFIAMPFSDNCKDSYEYGIKIVLDQHGIEHYKADNDISNKDIIIEYIEYSHAGELQQKLPNVL